MATLVAKLRERLDRPAAPWWIAAIATLLLVPTLWTGLGADDHHFRMVLQGFPGLPELEQAQLDIFTFAPGEREHNEAWVERGLLPWWSTPSVRLAFWRPLAAVTHWLDHVLWRDRTVPIHLHGLGWYMLLIAAALATYRRLCGRAWVATLAALLYAVDDARLISVAWVAARNSVMSATAAFLVLLAHDRWRRDGSAAAGVAGTVALALGLLCGESTVGVMGYLVAYALFLDRSPPIRRLASLAPYLGLTGLWLVVHRALGYGAEGSGLYLDPLHSPLRFAAAAVQHGPVLLLDQFSGVQAGWWVLTSGGWAWLHWGAGLAVMAFVAWALWPLLRRSPQARFWAGGLVLAAVPACAVFPQSRVLFLVGIGGMGLTARLIEAYLEQPCWWYDGRRWATPVGVLAPAWLVIHLVAGPATGFLGSGWMAVFDHGHGRLSAGIPREPSIADEEVTIVALPADILLHGLPYRRSSLRWPSPRRLRALYAGVAPIEVRRADGRTLVLEADDSFVSRPWSLMFRGPAAHPFAVGDEVRLSGLVVRVLEVDGRGRATRARFRFDRPLEEASDHWLTWSEQGLVPFDLPPVGQTVRLERIGVFRMFERNLRDYVLSGAWLRRHTLDTGPL